MALCIAATACYYILGPSVFVMLALSGLLLVYAMGITGKGILNNPVTRFLSDISLELYLSHMVIYRVLEKLHMLKLFGDGLLSYLFASAGVLCGTILFALAAKWGLKKTGCILQQLKSKKTKGE